MNRRPILMTCVALCLALTTGLKPAWAGGLISTERLLQQTPTESATPTINPADQRSMLAVALVSAGVDREQAQTRLAALTDAEIAELKQNIDRAPAGGLWFVPFLLVAAVIGALIGTREGSGGKPATNLFGQPVIASVP